MNLQLGGPIVDEPGVTALVAPLTHVAGVGNSSPTHTAAGRAFIDVSVATLACPAALMLRPATLQGAEVLGVAAVLGRGRASKGSSCIGAAAAVNGLALQLIVIGVWLFATVARRHPAAGVVVRGTASGLPAIGTSATAVALGQPREDRLRGIAALTGTAANAFAATSVTAGGAAVATVTGGDRSATATSGIVRLCSLGCPLSALTGVAAPAATGSPVLKVAPAGTLMGTPRRGRVGGPLCTAAVQTVAAPAV